MLFFKTMKQKKKIKLNIDEMIALEKKLKEFREQSEYGKVFSEANPAERLRLKVEYTEEIGKKTEAVLMPIEDEDFFGLIKVKKSLEKQKFAYMHEIVHYVFDVGIGKRVQKEYDRSEKGETPSKEEQEINYLTAAAIMNIEDIQKDLKEYDESRPKKDEILFVQDLKKKYDQSQEAVLRRIREARILEGKV